MSILTCAEIDCTEPVHVKKRGLCKSHYFRMRHAVGKLLPPKGERQGPPAVQRNDFECARCGAVVTPAPGSRSRKFCSATCRNTTHNANYRAKRKPGSVSIRCLVCSERFEGRGKRQTFCSATCRNLARGVLFIGPRMELTCALAECDVRFAPQHRKQKCCSERHGKLLCGREERANAQKVLLTCDFVFCDNTMLRERARNRKHGQYCSDKCRGSAVSGTGMSEPLPADHWALWYGKTCKWTPPTFLRPCAECGSDFLPVNNHERWLFCSYKCRKRVTARRRRARVSGAAGHHARADVLAAWLAIGQCCTYCERFLDEHEVTADHVIPLAKGGSDWPENIVPACGACNSDKRELLFDEWLADRARRGLDARVNLMAA